MANGIGAMVPEGYHTISEAAKMCKRSVDTLRRWKADGTFVPSHVMKAGKIQVALYTDDDIDAMRKMTSPTLRRSA